MELEYQENKYRASMMLTAKYPREMKLLRTVYLKLNDMDSDEKIKILENIGEMKYE